MPSETIGQRLARELFELGNEPNSPCQRLEFKGGEWPAKETSQGGICEPALASWLDRHIQDCLRESEETDHD